MSGEARVTVMTMADGTHKLLQPGQRLTVDANGKWSAKWQVRNYQSNTNETRKQTLGYAVRSVEVLSELEASYRFKLDERRTHDVDSRPDFKRMREETRPLRGTTDET